jgi:hypothetical protein
MVETISSEKFHFLVETFLGGNYYDGNYFGGEK